MRFSKTGKRLCDYYNCNKSYFLKPISGGLYCKDHYSDLLNNCQTPMSYRTHDRQGRKMCDAVGCSLIHNLVEAFNGKFCSEHAEQLKNIRSNITHDNINDHSFSSDHFKEQHQVRTDEMLFRKSFDEGHVTFLLTLEHKISNDSTCN